MSFRVLTNSLEEDPFVLIESLDKKSAFLFDCGLKVRGNYRRLRKLKAIFVTHSHIDHLIGFDHILRSMLSETTVLDMYGPKNFIRKMVGRMSSYDWDRAHEQNLTLQINEITPTHIETVKMSSATHFEAGAPARASVHQVINYDNEYFIQWCHLDHGGSCCLGYSIKTRDRWRVNKDKFQCAGLNEGPWVGKALKSLEAGQLHNACIPDLPAMPIEELEKKIFYFQAGKKIAYITDTRFTERVSSNVLEIADKADLLICEGTFILSDQHLAKQYNHLTAQEAAMLAQHAGVKQLLLNHPSRRYHGKFQLLLDEARDIFPDTSMVGYRGERMIL